MRAPLSEIEGSVLALVQELGPVTPYVVRMDYRDSPTPQWSGSAGTIYPLVRRLLRRGLIRSTVHYTGDRRGRRIILTPAGRRAFRCWLALPGSASVAGVSPDPLRTRVRFLAALSTKARRQFITEAHRSALDQLRVLEADCERQRALGLFPYLMARGALLSMHARLAFLREVRAALNTTTPAPRRRRSSSRR